jgi:hypothetical protein
MNPDSYQNADKFIKEEWFQDHRAEHTTTLEGIFDLIQWKRPLNNNYLMVYILIPGYLIVTGDVGDAIYASGLSTFKQWADCDIGYFAGKCVASESGRQYREWDSDFLKKRIMEALKEHAEENEQEIDKSWKDFVAYGGSSSMCSQQEWISWLTDKGSIFFGPDPCCWPADGQIISIRCKGHLIGLKMAVKQLALV